MKAEYEKQADLLVIELEATTEVTRGELSPVGPIIEYVGERPVAVEVLSASKGLQDKLSWVAGELGLESELLTGLAAAAIENSDTLVTLKLEVLAGEHLN